MLIKNGGVYPETWKNILCITRYSQVTDMEANWEAVKVDFSTEQKLRSLEHKYIAVKSLMGAMHKKDIEEDLKRVSEAVSGLSVKINKLGK